MAHHVLDKIIPYHILTQRHLTTVTPFLLRLLASTLAQLRMTDDTGVLAVQKDIIQLFVGKVGAIQGGFDITFREA